MLIEWVIVIAIVGVTLFLSVRSVVRTMKGEKACCSQGDTMGCQLKELMHEHNMPEPKACNGKPVTGAREVEEYRNKMQARRKDLASHQEG